MHPFFYCFDEVGFKVANFSGKMNMKKLKFTNNLLKHYVNFRCDVYFFASAKCS